MLYCPEHSVIAIKRGVNITLPVSCSYTLVLGGNQTLFVDANFQLVKGHRYGIVGANGAGKSTFLRMLMGRGEKTSG